MLGRLSLVLIPTLLTNILGIEIDWSKVKIEPPKRIEIYEGNDNDAEGDNLTPQTTSSIVSIQLSTTSSAIVTTQSSYYMMYRIEFDEVRNIEDIYSELWINDELIATRKDIGIFFGNWGFEYEIDPIYLLDENNVKLITRSFGSYEFKISKNEEIFYLK